MWDVPDLLYKIFFMITGSAAVAAFMKKKKPGNNLSPN